MVGFQIIWVGLLGVWRRFIVVLGNQFQGVPIGLCGFPVRGIRRIMGSPTAMPWLRGTVHGILLLIICGLLFSCQSVNLGKARDHYARGEYHDAANAYRELYRKLTREQRATRGVIAYEMAENYRHLNQSTRAATAYRNAIRYGYPDTLMVYHLARMLHQEGKYEEAVTAYRDFLTLRPDDPLGVSGLSGVEQAVKLRDTPTRFKVQREPLFNSTRADFSPMFSPRGDRLYFTSSREEAGGEGKSPVTGMKYNDLFYAETNVHGEWQKPKRIESGVNSDFDEGTPSFSPDGEWMFYTYSSPDATRPTGTAIYLSRRVNAEWSGGQLLLGYPAGKPLGGSADSLSVTRFMGRSVPLGASNLAFLDSLFTPKDAPANTGGSSSAPPALSAESSLSSPVSFADSSLSPSVSFAHPSVSPCGNYLYFVSDMPGGMGGKDVWRGTLKKRSGTMEVGVIKNLGPEINTPGDEMFPYVRNDTTLYFSSNGHPGMGGLDLFVAVRPTYGQRWEVQNMGSPMNSPADDFGITFYAGAEKGFFSSNRDDARGYDHIYSFEYLPPVIRVEGAVLNHEEEAIPGATVQVVGNDGGKRQLHTDSEGAYRFEADAGVEYLLLANAKGFLNRKSTLPAIPIAMDTLLRVDFEMIPFDEAVVLENIFYDFDSASLRPESETELEKLVDLMNEFPEVLVELSAHTDRKGSDEYNEDLSRRRAESVVAYLVNRGIDKGRLSATGHGKTQPVIVSKRLANRYDFLQEGDVLTEEFIEGLEPEQQEVADQLNRRTSFTVIGDGV
ncbi:MAG: OmpA family protein [Bacteroidota bacterium]|nr:OmpA family protein [Bacteroidota bacterium]